MNIENRNFVQPAQSHQAHEQRQVQQAPQGQRQAPQQRQTQRQPEDRVLTSNGGLQNVPGKGFKRVSVPQGAKPLYIKMSGDMGKFNGRTPGAVLAMPEEVMQNAQRK